MDDSFPLLVQARTTIDRMTVERSILLARIARLEQMVEATRDMAASIARGGRAAAL